MDIVISHITALEAMRRWDLRGRFARGERCGVCVPSSVGDPGELFSPGSLLGSFGPPINALVSNRGALTRRPGIVTHLQSGPLPEGSAVRLSDGVLCSSPELLAVQMAPQLTMLGLVCLLSELMGLYAVSPGSEDGMFQRDVPLTTSNRVRDYLGRLGARPGTRMVREALKRACVRSGSPRETKLALRLGLKPALGGHHLNVLSMNEPIKVRRIHDHMSEGVRKPDILIASPDGSRVVALEYLGERHNEPRRLVQDATRSNELKGMGIGEYQMRKEHYGDIDYFDGLVGVIRRELGYSRIGVSAKDARKRRGLRIALLRDLDALDDCYRYRPRDEGELPPGDHARIEAAEAGEQVPIEAYGLA